MITITGQGFDTTPLAISGYSHQVASPRDSASGQATGKRQHKPLTITKEIDKATPLLMRAIFTNQTLPIVQMSLNDPDGKPEAPVG
jgi:type VI secretion system secreted protein Hcp